MFKEEDIAEATSIRPWPAERIERWTIDRLIPYADNARLHSEADVDKLAHSLRRWGWTNPVLVDENGVLICGHGRIRAAAKLGLSSIPVMVVNTSSIASEAFGNGSWLNMWGISPNRQAPRSPFSAAAPSSTPLSPPM